jgi:hypothetical protein
MFRRSISPIEQQDPRCGGPVADANRHVRVLRHLHDGALAVAILVFALTFVRVGFETLTGGPDQLVASGQLS